MKNIKGLRQELEKHGLDAFLCVQNTRYLTGTDAGKAVIVPQDDAPILICSRLEYERVRQRSRIRDIRAFSSWKSPLQRGERVFFLEPWQLIVKCLKELGARSVGYDKASRAFIRKLRNAYSASYREKPEIMEDLRKIKSNEELALLSRSAEIAERGMNRAAELIEPGRTELEVAAEAEYRMRKLGSSGTPFQTVVASGGNSWLPHSSATKKKLAKGELIVVDLGANFNGYASDMTRTFALAPTSKQSKILQIVKRAQLAALAKVRSGAKAMEVDAAARSVIERAGYAKFFTHSTGHGVGLEIHELPSLAPNSKDILKRGMVITVEPGVYLPNVGGARWEDMLVVTKDGYRLLTL